MVEWQYTTTEEIALAESKKDEEGNSYPILEKYNKEIETIETPVSESSNQTEILYRLVTEIHRGF